METLMQNTIARHLKIGIAVLAFGLAAKLTWAGDSYPSKPIRFIVPAATGGALDLTTRLVALKMGEKLGQTIIVENRPGGDTLLGTRFVKEAPADGYTVFASANGITLLPQMKLNPGYDPLKDFTGIGFMTRAPLVLEVSADQPDRSLADFMARVKAHPGKLSYGHAGVGTPPHIAAAAFLHAAGLDMLSVPYKGNGAALPDVIGNRLEMIFDGYISSSSFIKSGKFRPLAVSSAVRIAPLPNVATFKEQGIDYTYTLWLGLLVRAGTSTAIVQKLSDALRYALQSQELSERFQNEGSDASFVTPEVFNDLYAKEVAHMAKLAADLKLAKE
jgi:tripartite-type tricarboxylate transporter receptor subunit TctC